MEYRLVTIISSFLFLAVDSAILLNTFRHKDGSDNQKIFQTFNVFTVLQQAFAILNLIAYPIVWKTPAILQYFFYIGLFCTMSLCSMFWYLYLRALVTDNSKMSNMRMAMLSLPIAILVIACLASPITHWVFYIDADGEYQRGSLVVLQIAVPYFYAVLAIIMGIVTGRKGNKARAEKMVRYFLVFAVPSIFCAIIQMSIVQGGFTAIGISMGLILMYMELYVEDAKENMRLKTVDIMNQRLSEVNQEQEAQLEEIKTLNEELEERQAQLEEASAEQESQLEEISLLNSRLSQQGAIVASAGLGTWNIYLKNDAAPRMHPDEKMRELLGIEGMSLSEEEIYSFWHDRILPDALESVNNSVSKIISGVFDENTYQWNHPAKGVIYVRCGGNAITLPDGTIVLSGYHADVTDIVFKEKKQQEALEKAVLEAKKANEAKSRFLSRMSHDIRTPLNGIIGLIELSDRHPDDVDTFNAGREKARVASQHLLSLVNDVLELSKLDDRNVKLAHEPFNILELAGDVLTIAESSAAEYGVSLHHEECRQEFKYPYVYGSPLHVRQILLNIFSNAAKYNHPGGSIYCRGRFEGKTDTTVTYTVEIEDTGIGMSQEFLEQLFEPFTQEHSDARSTFQGTGLGMAIVKSLVDKMNGTIAVESEEGKGSKFTVTIPFELANEADMPKKADVDEKDITGKKLLLVEDNELNMEIARSILEDFGAIITEAKNGQEAVNIFEQNAPNTFDAILMDVMMPVLDGYGATRKIRELSREDAKNIPIIAMTANAFEEDKQNALKAGMNAHIAKPIEIPKLIETLSSIVK